MSLEADNPQDDLSIFATAIPPLDIEEILAPRVKAFNPDPIKWGSITIYVTNGKPSYFDYKGTSKRFDI